ncbi:MAG: septum formation protein Maf [Peptococcaceae bacterium]|jgi:septum formation protein|nr:septum formation protein Maf [Peptococcaceae bacterium]
MKKEFVLASASPRRLAILQQIGITPEVVVSAAEEIKEGDPADVVKINALAKGRAVAPLVKNKIIIASDTVVAANGQILGKPQDAAEALAMLMSLAGKSHWVYSSVAIIDSDTGACLVDVDQTEVFFTAVEETDLQKYIKTGEPMDKAGAYGIQEKGALLVEKICGDYYTVMGLPLHKLKELLSSWRINLWDYIGKS